MREMYLNRWNSSRKWKRRIPHLFSQLQTRKLAVTGLDWEVQSFSDDERDKEIAEFIDEQLKGIENLDDIFIDMLDAIGKGVSVMEIEWGLDSDLTNIIENIEYVHPKKTDLGLPDR